MKNEDEVILQKHLEEHSFSFYPKDALAALRSIYQEESSLGLTRFDQQKMKRLLATRIHDDLIELMALKENLQTLFPNYNRTEVDSFLTSSSYYAKLEVNYQDFYEGDPNQLPYDLRYYYAKTLPLLQQRVLLEEHRSLLQLEAKEYFFGLKDSFYHPILQEWKKTNQYPILSSILNEDATFLPGVVPLSERSNVLELVMHVKRKGVFDNR